MSDRRADLIQALLEIKGMHAVFRKRAKKKKKENVRKGKNIWNFGQKFTEIENILKKGRWLLVVSHNKQ